VGQAAPPQGHAVGHRVRGCCVGAAASPRVLCCHIRLPEADPAAHNCQRTSETAAVTPPPLPASAAVFATDASNAVLPFVNMSPDKEQEYFADGISEELLNLLAHYWSFINRFLI